MDLATVIGILLGVVLVVGSILIGGGGLGPFINVPSLMITVGGSIAAILINFPLSNVFSVFAVTRKCFLTSLPSTEEVIERFRNLSTSARRDGLLALESELDEIRDGFLRRGLEMVIGGTSAEDVESVLSTEVNYIEQRHQMGKKLLDATAAAAPAFGMIGTLIGLVQMLRTLDDPSQIGVGMATALLTTLYGALIANLFCIPLAGKLEARSQEEVMLRELMIMGLTGLVEGHPPRVLEERLHAFLSPSRRPDREAA
ncbi:MAG: MotA/TolQ/ExbB proton channel family protein [Planctomycetaceae bacterium]|nr:MotA/TolQ/ExbB proton channel family protein [Planctomycetaceae bacterium]MCA9108403.1 MotA/TolQ/ExbB proton channel family protein [Planctomycetaceae bacterium]